MIRKSGGNLGYFPIIPKVAFSRYSKFGKQLCTKIRGKAGLIGARGLSLAYGNVHEGPDYSGWRIEASNRRLYNRGLPRLR